jgi:plastocyanin
MLALAACSGTGASGAPSAAPPSEAPASEAPASVAPSAVPSEAASAPTGTVQDLALIGKDFAFEGPTTIPAGLTKITLTNEGAEDHQAQLAKLADGTTLEDLTALLASGDETGALAKLTLAGGPNAVVPGASGSTTSNLTPGNYVFLCFVSGADNVPHLAKGMIAPLEVTGTAVEAEPPAGDASLTLQDFAFVGLDSLSTGPHTITVTNSGPQPHEATIVKLADGVAATDLLAMFTSTEAPSGPPPFTSAGGLTGLAVGETATMDVDLPAGNYAFICFVPDQASGAPHAALGMIGALTVE